MDITVEPQSRLLKALGFTQRFAASVPVTAVSIAYANKFGLSPATCKLYYHGSQLTDQTLEQVSTDRPFDRRDRRVSLVLWRTGACVV